MWCVCLCPSTQKGKFESEISPLKTKKKTLTPIPQKACTSTHHSGSGNAAHNHTHNHPQRDTKRLKSHNKHSLQLPPSPRSQRRSRDSKSGIKSTSQNAFPMTASKAEAANVKARLVSKSLSDLHSGTTLRHRETQRPLTPMLYVKLPCHVLSCRLNVRSPCVCPVRCLPRAFVLCALCGCVVLKVG